MLLKNTIKINVGPSYWKFMLELSGPVIFFSWVFLIVYVRFILVAFFIGNVQIQVWQSGCNTGSLVGWERNEYGFGIPCRYPKAIGKYGFGPGLSV